jgi:hypothetical protein
MTCENCDYLRVDASGLAPSTISTAIGLVNAELRARKAELRGCTDLARRKRLVARIETLRAALSDLDAEVDAAWRAYLARPGVAARRAA